MNVPRLAQHRRYIARGWPRDMYFSASFLMALLTLVSLVYATNFLWHTPYIGMSWDASSGHIDRVDADGPAAHAGIRAGDKILAINGIPPSHISFSRYQKIFGRLGEAVTFTLQRHGQVVTITMPIPGLSWHVRVRYLLPLFVAFGFWAVSLGVWIFHHAHRVTCLFFLTSQITASLLTVGTITTVYPVQGTWPVTVFRLLLLAVPPLTLHFFTIFPEETPHAFRRRALTLAYGMAGVLASVTLGIHAGLIAPKRLYDLGNYTYVVLVFFFTLFVLFRRWGKDSLLTLRYRRVLVMSMGASIIPLLFFALIPDLIWGTPLIDYTWTFPFLVIIPVIYAQTLRTGELGTVDWVLSRTLAHLLLSGVFFMVYFLLFLWLNDFFYFARPMSPVLIAGLAVIAAAFFSPTRRALLHFADHFLYGGWYDYRVTLQELCRQLRERIRFGDLTGLLVDQLSDILRLRGAALLLPEGERFQPVRTTGVFNHLTSLLAIPDARLATYLVHAGHPLPSAQIHRALLHASLTPEERRCVDLPDIALWLPLVHNGKLKGVLLLGSRVSGDPLDQEDLRLLDILAAHAATAVENIQLVESLDARVEEIKHLYAQLSQAREEERKHLARELHDVVLQDLINAYVTLDQVLSTSGDGDWEQLRWIHDQVLHTIHTLRRLCSELRPPALDITDLRSAIEGLVEEVRRESELDIVLIFPERGYRALDGLPDTVNITLYRVLQETLTNVRRHAHARQVYVRVHKEPDWISLEVEDDGCGFVVPPRLSLFVREQHYGLAGMAERVQAVGGTIDVLSAPGEGTRIQVRIPL